MSVRLEKGMLSDEAVGRRATTSMEVDARIFCPESRWNFLINVMTTGVKKGPAARSVLGHGGIA